MMDLLNSVDYIFLKVFEDDEALSISTCIFSSIALVLLHTSANGWKNLFAISIGKEENHTCSFYDNSQHLQKLF